MERAKGLIKTQDRWLVVLMPAKTPLWQLKRDRGCREKVKELVAFNENRGSCDQSLHMQKVLAQVLDYVILQ